MRVSQRVHFSRDWDLSDGKVVLKVRLAYQWTELSIEMDSATGALTRTWKK